MHAGHSRRWRVLRPKYDGARDRAAGACRGRAAGTAACSEVKATAAEETAHAHRRAAMRRNQTDHDRFEVVQTENEVCAGAVLLNQ